MTNFWISYILCLCLLDLINTTYNFFLLIYPSYPNIHYMIFSFYSSQQPLQVYWANIYALIHLFVNDPIVGCQARLPNPLQLIIFSIILSLTLKNPKMIAKKFYYNLMLYWIYKNLIYRLAIRGAFQAICLRAAL